MDGRVGRLADGWSASRRAPRPSPFYEDGLQYAPTITERVQIADSMDSRVLEAGNLSDDQACLGDANMDKGLDLKAVTPESSVAVRPRGRVGVQAQRWRMLPPEDVESITQI
jgi:hypothetical protein